MLNHRALFPRSVRVPRSTLSAQPAPGPQMSPGTASLSPTSAPCVPVLLDGGTLLGGSLVDEGISSRFLLSPYPEWLHPLWENRSAAALE